MLRFVCAGLLTIVSLSFAQRLEIRDVRGWGAWGAHCTSLDYKSTVNGTISRNVLTVTIKDTVSTTSSDSLEATFSFNLPHYSVVDSMYLWINGVPVSANLKVYSNAVAIYEGIVKRRRDPALLRKNGMTDNYILQIFPFARRQERKIRICYTTPLSALSAGLTSTIPLEMTSGSVFPVKAITAEVTAINTGASTMSLVNSYTGTATVRQNGASSTMTFADRDHSYSNPLAVTIKNPDFLSSGILINSSLDANGDVSFISLLTPEKLFRISATASNNVVIIWNAVSMNTQYDYTTREYTQNCQYVYSKAIEDDKYQIVSFIRNNLRPGDRLNLQVNNGDIAGFSSGLQTVTASTADKVKSFLDNALHTTSRTGCPEPIPFVKTSLASIGSVSEPLLILIDKNYHYSYRTPIDTAKVRADAAAIAAALPAASKVFGFFGYGYYTNALTILYQNVLTATKGIFVPAYSTASLMDPFSNVVPYLSGKFYPANLTFLGGKSGFPYDVLSPLDGNYYLRAPIVCFGKLRNSPQLRVMFNGVYNGSNYLYDKTFTLGPSLAVDDRMAGDLWAGEKVDRMLRAQSALQSIRNDALAISLENRILTPLTALLALEKGVVDTSAYHDDGQGSGYLTSVKTTEPTLKAGLVCHVLQLGSMVRIILDGMENAGPGTQVSITLYDLKGALAADLSEKAQRSSTGFIVNTGSLSTGTYLLKVRFKKQVFQKVITLVKQ